MSVPFPSDAEVKLVPPDAAEVAWIGRGVFSAVRPSTGHTELQDMLLKALFESMTGFGVDPDSQALDAGEFATGLACRNLQFRTRIVQVMLLGELILVPLPDEVSERVERFAAELGVDEGMISVARDFSKGSVGLALVDFERNGYTHSWDETRCASLHTSKRCSEAWQMAGADRELAARWAGLELCPPGALGRRVAEFYRSRGFNYPGLPGSAPPLLAQHDWVHVLADYGTTVESELEVFGLIGRAIPDFRGFSLLAMVVSLFETGYLPAAAGLFQADKGHLSGAGMPVRLGDAMRRGALCGKDLMAIDWFEYADTPLSEARKVLNIVPKSEAALAAGSMGPWERGGISPFQERSGRRMAESEGRFYDSYGASVI